MKTVIIGGSAQSTPALFDSCWALEAPRFSFELVGRSTSRASAVARAASLVAADRGYSIDCRYSSAEAADAAIESADVVLVQFRIGGYAARTSDETFPHRYGLCGDEGLGAGGLANAWRTWDELRTTLSTVARLNPRAVVILLTSPIGILTRCARDSFPELRLYGICELPWTTLNDLCRAASVEARGASYSYIAVNHLGWFSDVKAGDVAVVPAHDIHPLKYVRLHDSPAAVLSEQRASAPRGSELSRLASAAFAAYECGSAAEVLGAVRRRQTPWYEFAVAPLLHSLAGADTSITYFLSTANAGYNARFAADEILEMPFVVRGGAFERRPTSTWQRDDIAQMLSRLVAYERAAAAAVLARDVTKLRTALRAHPWLDRISVTDQLVADVVAEDVAACATSER